MNEATKKRRLRQEVARCEAILKNKRGKLDNVEVEVRRLRGKRSRDVERAEVKLSAAKAREERS